MWFSLITNASCTAIKIMQLFFGLIVLVVYDQLGKWLMRALDWPVPGSVTGLLLLLVTLVVVKQPPKPVQHASEWLLRHLAFFFVPAGVGILLLFGLIADEWLAMLLSMVVSTLMSLLFTAWLMQVLVQRVERIKDDV